ncbi:lipid droplet-associated hydrolase-like isoform X1 [Amphibalanus amphitrite]|uniref:lipid droplet-associated hydrolase-like isoform X1 n=2 Tax=Amphibalanus amphitrite TaxID=1232801 RepID=UPI001C906848|nr:lipid droplet-associated hydrolase-like isoform X1 [Amphibalanus amphitrite]
MSIVLKKLITSASIMTRKSAFVNVSGVPNLVITYGGWIDDCSAAEVVLVIPGNPGLIEYYDQFMSTLFEELGGKIPVWGISHGGHSLPENDSCLPDLNDHPSLYDLEGQTERKVEFIRSHLPAETRLHLVGHSIGSQISLQTERRLPPRRVASSYHLFPTVQRMRVSPAGRRVWLLSRYLGSLVMAVAALLAWLPRRVRAAAVRLWLPGDTPAHALEASVELLRPASVARAMAMAHDELIKVDQLDEELLRGAAPRARFYFSRSDPWVPLENVEVMKQAVPELDTVICENGYPHAFVLREDAVGGCAKHVATWVKKFSEVVVEGKEEKAM